MQNRHAAFLFAENPERTSQQAASRADFSFIQRETRVKPLTEPAGCKNLLKTNENIGEILKIFFITVDREFFNR